MACTGIIPMLRSHKQILFIVLFELFQRVSYFGFQIMLFLFLKHEMKYSVGASIGLYHLFVGLGYVATVICSVVADTSLPNFFAILVLTFVGINGNALIVLAACAAAPEGVLEIKDTIPYFLFPGLVLRAVGTGGIRDLVRGFGSDQFARPEDKRELNDYYQLLYYCMTVGTLLAYLIAPQLRAHVACYGEEYCFPLAFLVPGLLITAALLAFVCGTKLYTIKKSKGSAPLQCVLCLFSSLRYCRDSERFLDNSGFEPDFVADFRAVLPVLPLFVPLPIFWSLAEQMGSRWTYQASRMDGSVSRMRIEPDQMQLLNPVIVFLGIPVLELAVYPLMSLCRLSTALRRGALGGVLAVLAFAASAALQARIEDGDGDDSLTHQPKGVHMLWQIPQYLLISLAQFLYPLALLEFTYTQVPATMRPVLLTCWHLAIAMGNFIAMTTGFVDAFERELWNHVVFAGLMGVDLLLIVVVAWRYTTVYEEEATT